MSGKSRQYDIILYDRVGMRYTGHTPACGGLGGSEFQAILLAEGLAGNGRSVLVLNNSNEEAKVNGVDYANHAKIESITACDVLIVQRYSPLPPIAARKVIVAASDIPGNHYDHFAALFAGSQDATLVAVSEWQRKLFPPGWNSIVIPNMLPDEVYEFRCIAEPGRFVYASAALKGLEPTLKTWRELRQRSGRDDLKLRVCTPGYDQAETSDFADAGVCFLGSLPFRRVVEEIAGAAGIFYVNAWSETFGIVPALAEALKRRTHVLCTSDPGGLPETINSPLLTTDRETFERQFLEALATPMEPRWQASAQEFRASRLMDRWVELLDSKSQRHKPPPASAKVCLSMIVKNEAHVIARCLRSVKPYIHAWAVVDTGSTDGTQKIVCELMHDLPGELIERHWVDFATNRNQALELAQHYGNYALVIDADDTLEADPGFAWPALDAPGYKLEVQDAGNTRYWRVACPRLDADWEWRGVLHEALCTPVDVATPNLPGLRIMRLHNDGARSRIPQREKFLQDARILADALQKEPDNARYAFYLAQSLRDAGEIGEAINAYQKRVSMGGWAEEVYFSKLQVALLLERSGATYAEVAAAYLDAYDFRSTRAEAPCEAARFFRLNERYALARQFARVAAELPISDDVLFIDHAVHAWRARDELAVASYWCGDHAECARLCLELLGDDALPDSERERVTRNLGFCGTRT